MSNMILFLNFITLLIAVSSHASTSTADHDTSSLTRKGDAESRSFIPKFGDGHSWSYFQMGETDFKQNRELSDNSPLTTLDLNQIVESSRDTFSDDDSAGHSYSYGDGDNNYGRQNVPEQQQQQQGDTVVDYDTRYARQLYPGGGEPRSYVSMWPSSNTNWREVPTDHAPNTKMFAKWSKMASESGINDHQEESSHSSERDGGISHDKYRGILTNDGGGGSSNHAKRHIQRPSYSYGQNSYDSYDDGANFPKEKYLSNESSESDKFSHFKPLNSIYRDQSIPVSSYADNDEDDQPNRYDEPNKEGGMNEIMTSIENIRHNVEDQSNKMNYMRFGGEGSTSGTATGAREIQQFDDENDYVVEGRPQDYESYHEDEPVNGNDMYEGRDEELNVIDQHQSKRQHSSYYGEGSSMSNQHPRPSLKTTFYGDESSDDDGHSMSSYDNNNNNNNHKAINPHNEDMNSVYQQTDSRHTTDHLYRFNKGSRGYDYDDSYHDERNRRRKKNHSGNSNNYHHEKSENVLHQTGYDNHDDGNKRGNGDDAYAVKTPHKISAELYRSSGGSGEVRTPPVYDKNNQHFINRLTKSLEIEGGNHPKTIKNGVDQPFTNIEEYLKRNTDLENQH